MTPEEIWRRYAAAWSLEAEARGAAIAACLTEAVSYCDPDGDVEGSAALSTCMAQFQDAVPGGSFEINAVRHHHGRSLAHWTLHAGGGNPLHDGTSFAIAAEDGRTCQITGFFHPKHQ